jgi:hypothetical protein
LARLETRHDRAHGRNVRKKLGPRRPSHRQSAQLSRVLRLWPTPITAGAIEIIAPDSGLTPDKLHCQSKRAGRYV